MLLWCLVVASSTNGGNGRDDEDDAPEAEDAEDAGDTNKKVSPTSKEPKAHDDGVVAEDSGHKEVALSDHTGDGKLVGQVRAELACSSFGSGNQNCVHLVSKIGRGMVTTAVWWPHFQNYLLFL